MQDPQHRAARGAARAAVALAVSAALVTSGVVAANAATTNPNPGALEQENGALSRTAAAQGMVLLENHDKVLPLASSGNVALFGVGSYTTIKGGTGSGAVNNRYSINVRSGLENAGYTVTTNTDYYSAISAANATEPALTSTTVQPTAATDTAVFVLSRNSGEGRDRSAGKGDYQLTDNELANIKLIGQTYKKVVIVLNVGGIVDTSFFKSVNAAETDPAGGQALDSMLLMSQAGQEGGNAVTDVLKGAVTPSGKLTDTWASQYSYYPASATFGANDANTVTENYSEGIYVGYRYFDSKYATINPTDPASVVDYPFGYGLSYTDFSIDAQSVTADANSVTVKAKVTNVGSTYSGKEVVEVYYSAPQTGLDKAYQSLAGYAKTDSLAPGASQTVTIRYNTTDMASYDQDAAAYTLDSGEYDIRLGDSSRNTHVVSKLELGSKVTTEKLANEDNDQTSTNELTSDPSEFYSYPGESAEIAAAPAITLNPASFTTVNNASPYEQSVTVDPASPLGLVDGSKISTTTAYLAAGSENNWDGTGAPYAVKPGETTQSVPTDPTKTLFDVAKGNYTLKQFVAGLSVTQLSNIVEGATAAGSTPTAVGAAGYTTAKYESQGLPGMTLSDGPAGLRLTQKITSTTAPTTYQWETAWPVGTLLAQTWDRDLVKQVGAAVGQEMAEYGVSLWLAPGMNIHRDPLNGRNFEYYSEDPLVAGLTAAATTEGVQSVPGRGVTVKHFFGNNQEAARTSVNDLISERASREIYLRGFEIAVKTAQPMAIMTSYNKVNGSWSSANYDLNTDILRGEWGFKGLVMTDWGGSHNPTGVMYAGNDLIEPGNNQNEIVNSVKKVAPTIDVSGLPAYSKLTTLSNNRTTYTWSFGGLTPSATGATTISTPVNASNVTAAPLSSSTVRDTINNDTVTPNAPYTSVAAAYADVQSLLAAPHTGTGVTVLTAAQAAAITLTNVVHQDPSDATSPVVSYTVNVTGDYPAVGFPMRLGDLQRSATNIIHTAMQTAGFGQLATLNNITGITVPAYEAQFTNLASVLDSSKGEVVQAQTGHGPSVSITAGTAVPASGWYTGPVSVRVTSDDSNAQLLIDDGTGTLTNYNGAITVTGDGTHVIRAFAAHDGQYSAIKDLTVKIDSQAPVVSVTSAENGRLTLAATDAGSGIASIEYLVDGINWTKYTGTVTIDGAPKVVSYRSTDVAGNVSSANSVTVAAAATTATAPTVTTQPKAATTVNSGSKVTLTAKASGSPDPTVQWQVSTNDGDSWTNVAGATSTTYSFTSKAALSGNVYRAAFTNSAGTSYSANASITVKIVTRVSESISDKHITTSQREKVKVTVAPTSSKPTGTVTVHYGSKSVSVKLKAGDKGKVTVTLPKLKKGSYKLYASYGGSATFASDSSSKVTISVK